MTEIPPRMPSASLLSVDGAQGRQRTTDIAISLVVGLFLTVTTAGPMIAAALARFLGGYL
jgi:hypothetical protein